MPVIDLQACGPSERDWATVCDALAPFVWPACRRIVIVSPHPDDETLGAGGLIGVALQHGMPVVMLSVTDGEAASALPDLARVRRDELDDALHCLDPTGSIDVVRLGFADSAVTASIGALTVQLTARLDPSDLVVCPMAQDGHPDHYAVSVAATEAARTVGATVRWFPVWAWHCHNPASSTVGRGEKLMLPPVVFDRKERAARCYASQVAGDSPVVPPMMMARLLRGFEVFVDPQ